jgi:transketolase
MVAGHRKLRNLTLIIDRNRLQQGAGTEETSGLDPLDKRYEAFGFDVTMVNGHDHSALLDALSAPSGDKPRCVIANTVKGKGVSFMENVASWHHGVPNAAQYEQAMKELV